MNENKTVTTPYEVIEEIEILREYAFGIISDIVNINEKGQSNFISKLLKGVKDSVSDLYNEIFRINTLKDIYICRGKLQAFDEIVKSIKDKE